jgi:hypothetical protein
MVINHNPDPEDDILINSFKYEPEAKVRSGHTHTTSKTEGNCG